MIRSIEDVKKYLMEERGCSEAEFNKLHAFAEESVYGREKHGEFSRELDLCVHILNQYEGIHAAYELQYEDVPCTTYAAPPEGSRPADTGEVKEIIRESHTLATVLGWGELPGHTKETCFRFLHYVWGNDVPDEYCLLTYNMYETLYSVENDAHMEGLMLRFSPEELKDLLAEYFHDDIPTDYDMLMNRE